MVNLCGFPLLVSVRRVAASLQREKEYKSDKSRYLVKKTGKSVTNTKKDEMGNYIFYGLFSDHSVEFKIHWTHSETEANIKIFHVVYYSKITQNI